MSRNVGGVLRPHSSCLQEIKSPLEEKKIMQLLMRLKKLSRVFIISCWLFIPGVLCVEVGELLNVRLVNITSVMVVIRSVGICSELVKISVVLAWHFLHFFSGTSEFRFIYVYNDHPQLAFCPVGLKFFAPRGGILLLTEVNSA